MIAIRHTVRFTTVLFGLVALLFTLAPVGTKAQTDERCFSETGYCISGRIREYWEQNGGLPVFGLPIGPQQEETIEGQPIQAQWFERNRLELHPENARPYDVLLGRLGVDRLTQQGRDWFTFAKGQPQDGCLFFAESGHSICEPFLSAWRASGLELDGAAGKSQAENLALFGLPISEPQTETMSDGKEYTVQWFERARFESHPENQPPFNVLLGLLGSEVRNPPANPEPEPEPEPSTMAMEGRWSGTTSQGATIEFTVVKGNIIYTEVNISCGSDSSEFVSRSQTPIQGDRFTWQDSLFNITGTFTSPNNATGTVQINSPDIECGGSLSDTWNASFSRATPFDGIWTGSTSEGTDFSFTVHDSAVIDPEVQLKDCTIYGISLSGEFPVQNNTFYGEGFGGKFKVSGTFNGETSTGNIEVQLPSCSLIGTWSATRQ